MGWGSSGWLKRLAAAAGAAVVWELAWRGWDALRAAQGEDYWRNYYAAETLRRSDQIRLSFIIRSTGVRLHIDVYPRPEPDAPVVIFNHGAAGYSRLFVPLALAFHERGYTVLLPDQRGQGFSGGGRGDYTVAECTRNIVDVAGWARSRFGGPLFIAGGSVGGALTYYAAAQCAAAQCAAAGGAPVTAIACLNLFDFGNGADGWSISRLARHPWLGTLSRPATVLLAPFGRLRLPFRWFGAFDRLMDERDWDFQQLWDADPVPPRRVSIRSLLSNLTTPPAIPFEENAIPTLVINQRRDRMVDPAVTRRNYERLGGPKRYLEVDFGHWSGRPEFWEALVGACDEWFHEYRKVTAHRGRLPHSVARFPYPEGHRRTRS